MLTVVIPLLQTRNIGQTLFSPNSPCDRQLSPKTKTDNPTKFRSRHPLVSDQSSRGYRTPRLCHGGSTGLRDVNRTDVLPIL
jgi:hypothetical protein